MGLASVALALLIIPTSTLILIFPTYQIAFAQVDEGSDQTLNPIIGIVLASASTLIGIFLTNRHSLKVKKQEPIV